MIGRMCVMYVSYGVIVYISYSNRNTWNSKQFYTTFST